MGVKKITEMRKQQLRSNAPIALNRSKQNIETRYLLAAISGLPVQAP